jgi:solute carrier family 25 (mitochondrial S-adenosylmethionine transporter), member 26
MTVCRSWSRIPKRRRNVTVALATTTTTTTTPPLRPWYRLVRLLLLLLHAICISTAWKHPAAERTSSGTPLAWNQAGGITSTSTAASASAHAARLLLKAARWKPHMDTESTTTHRGKQSPTRHGKKGGDVNPNPLLVPAVVVVDNGWTLDCVKTAVAGGVAGAVGTLVLYPLDAAKTLRQASPHQFSSVRAALMHKCSTRTVYRGLGTAVWGAMPSSALYFGAYETMRQAIGRYILWPRHQQRLGRRQRRQHGQDGQQYYYPINLNELDIAWQTRCVWHAAAAASGNLLSSAIFVPKELIKQRLQFALGSSSSAGTSLHQVVTDIVLHDGLSGLYRGYRATVLRNIPSAALRFCLYEEFKRHVVLTTTCDKDNHAPAFSWRLFVAGAAAGALASGIMTPIDVIKTKIATGTCPVDLPSCVQTVVTQHGVSALWSGAGSRMLSSAAFSAIGFGTYEGVRRWLGVVSTEPNRQAVMTSCTKQTKEPRRRETNPKLR